jgi:FkbM family methyltransferase
LVYDIGAADDGVEPFLKQGAKKVIGIEPVKAQYKILEKKYKNNKDVIVLNLAIGSKDGLEKMYICNSRYFSTFSKEQVDCINNQEETKNLEFYKEEMINILSLDTLIKKYGMPYFCKIDVEGYEPEVLSGLSKPIDLISFEYNTLFPNKAISCIEILEKLGEYEFNLMKNKENNIKNKEWVNADNMMEIVSKFNSDEMNFGDIYCRLIKKITTIAKETSK